MSTDLAALLREVRERLTAEADPNRATFGEGYHATAMRIRRVRTPVLRDLAGELREKPHTAVELPLRLVESGGYEERTLAYILLSRHRSALASLHADRIEALGAGIDNWGSVDAYCTLVAGPAWLAGQLGYQVIDRWSRRAARVHREVRHKLETGLKNRRRA